MKKSKVSRLTKKGTPAKTTRTKRSSSHEDFNISTDIKKQLLGFLILLFGVLIGLALISYSDKDQATLEKLSLLDVFRREAYSAVNVTFNWLGIAGAYVSNFFINSFFGYFSIFVAVVLVLFGSTLLRKKPLGKTIQFSIYSLLLMLCLASTFGLLRIFHRKRCRISQTKRYLRRFLCIRILSDAWQRRRFNILRTVSDIVLIASYRR
jgi:S-DNA-T family DNA segregation ATPase FtsK/SpoIIIE